MDICLQLAEKRNVQLIVTTHESKYVLDKCNKMGFQFCVTNPCFEFWLLLHFDEVFELDEEKYPVGYNISLGRRKGYVMIKGAKSFSTKYEKIMGESSADKLWNDVKNGIDEFTRKIELGQADGYFWNMYFNLLRENRILFEGVNKAIVTGDMNYMLNGIYQENRFNCIYQNRSNSGGAQTINFIEVVIAYSCNDYSLLEKIMPFEEGPATCGYSAPFYNMLYAVTYHDNEVGNKAQAELSAFMGKKRTQFDLKLAKFFYDLYQKDVDGINCGLQELCESMGKCNWINEHIYGMDKNVRSLGNTVAIFIHGLYHIVMKFLKDTPLSEKIKMPEHKSFIKEYEEFNKEHDFPEPQILVDFDQLAKFINLSIRTEFIPEVSFYKSGRNYVNDGKKLCEELEQYWNCNLIWSAPVTP